MKSIYHCSIFFRNLAKFINRGICNYGSSFFAKNSCDFILIYNYSGFRLFAAVIFYSNFWIFYVKFSIYIIFWFVIFMTCNYCLLIITPTLIQYNTLNRCGWHRFSPIVVGIDFYDMLLSQILVGTLKIANCPSVKFLNP